jgi:SAM-dependent methyltransferase
MEPGVQLVNKREAPFSKWYPESRFGGFSWVDGTIAFYARVNALITPESTVLDIGCGRGAYGADPVRVRGDLQVLKGKARRVIGIDVDPVARANEFIDEFRLISDSGWPVETCSIDVAVADKVLEHVESPAEFFAEAARTVRPGGHICIRTSNVLGYVGIAARLTPNRFHARLVGRALKARDQQDVFPTFHRCNTIWSLRRSLEQHGFDGVVQGFESEPYYLGFSRLAYALGVSYQRLAPGAVRSALFAFARRG